MIEYELSGVVTHVRERTRDRSGKNIRVVWLRSEDADARGDVIPISFWNRTGWPRFGIHEDDCIRVGFTICGYFRTYNNGAERVKILGANLVATRCEVLYRARGVVDEDDEEDMK